MSTFMGQEVSDVIPECYQTKSEYLYRSACCYRGVIVGIADDHSRADIEWTESIPPGATTTVKGIKVDAACANCMLPDGVESMHRWLCADDNVLVLDSTVVGDTERFMIIGLDLKYHSDPVAFCRFTGGGFALTYTKYGQPFYTEEEILDDDGQPTGFTECTPIITNGHEGTETGLGKMITAAVSPTSVVGIKRHQIPNFDTTWSWYNNTDFVPYYVNGFFLKATSDIRVGTVTATTMQVLFDISVSRVCSRTMANTETRNYTESHDFPNNVAEYRLQTNIGYAGAGGVDGFGYAPFFFNEDLKLMLQTTGGVRVTMQPQIDDDGTLNDATFAVSSVATSASATTDIDYSVTVDETRAQDCQQYANSVKTTTDHHVTDSFSGQTTLRDYGDFYTVMDYSMISNGQHDKVEIINYDITDPCGPSESASNNGTGSVTDTETFSADYSFIYSVNGEEFGRLETTVASSYDYYGDKTVSMSGQNIGIIASDCVSMHIVALKYSWFLPSTDTGDSYSLEVDFKLVLIDRDCNEFILESWKHTLDSTTLSDVPRWFSGGNYGCFAFGGSSGSTVSALTPTTSPYTGSLTENYDVCPAQCHPQYHSDPICLYYDYASNMWPSGKPSEEVALHLRDKLVDYNHIYFIQSRVFFDSVVDRLTGVGCITNYSPDQVGLFDDREFLAEIVAGKDKKTVRVTYFYDGTEKERYFIGGVEIDIQELKES